MSGVPEQPITWEELARREIDAARVGGRVWQEFVSAAVSVTHRPWSEVRRLIKPYVAAEYRRRGLT